MKTLVFVVGILAVLDLVITPVMLSNIRKTGGFHYLVTTFHKFFFLVLILGSGIFAIRNDVPNMLFQLVFSASFLFILNATFEINDHLINKPNPDNYNLDGMTEEGKKAMNVVFEHMNRMPGRSFTDKLFEMANSFLNNMQCDLGVVYMLLTNNKEMKQSYEDLHTAMGNATLFSSMSMRELLLMVKSRILVDFSALAFAVALAVA